MSDTNMEDVKDQELVQGHGDNAEQDVKASDESHDDHPMPSVQKEEETIKKKYGGIIPKKPPLISKDHERAYFDSADWALGKGTHKPKGPLEALRPKLQPTPHQQVRSRRASYARADDVEVDGVNNNTSEEDIQSGVTDGSTNTVTEDQSRHE
ncbi:PREDICTED: uncharacterized protein LOC101301964 isoform X2 [Fragaria vesca subsp. vesca]|uniref:uncharacterized protein LOC101301964 isoform X2 n=1 Tax=Fragaria vesca subsp. vesca TaxID=101020 RepID=UPI0002C339E9|nr:PREDICTED: uncharacterized protein LOC101301964 isoform X2 [Fragaria vesca subsp. vesca]XP_011463055.1 PREDICTED: uncharacterized protein LOC101301964 isoform X2 [Fragaria vesca subsp. vesca]